MTRNRLTIIGFIGVAILGLAYLAFGRSDPPPKYRFAKIETGPIVAAVNATGTVQAVVTVQVGSQISGQVIELLADFNAQVKANDVIARIDSDQIAARVHQAEADVEAARAAVLRTRSEIESARAALATARHQTVRAEVQLKDAERDNARKQDLVKRGAATVADTERAQNAFESARVQVSANKAQADQATAAVASAEAALRVAEAQVMQRQAALEQVRVEFDRATIRSPIDGVVVLRNVDLGQTVAASLQAPTLFTIAQDLKQMQVHASIDEADIGKVEVGQPTTFTVTAHPGRVFQGVVEQIRLAPQVVQNVVTYVVVIAADNADLKLLPGMTATLRIVSSRRDSALKVPNAALRYRPTGASSSTGAPPAAPVAGGGGGGGGRGPAQSTEQILTSLTERLGLSAEQQAKVKDALDEGRKQIQAIPQDLPSEQRRARFQALRGQIGERIAGVLTPEQRPIYAEIRQAQTGGAASAPTAGQIWVLDGDKPKGIALRLGIGDGQFTEVVAGEIKDGQDVIVGGGDRAAAGGPPRIGF